VGQKIQEQSRFQPAPIQMADDDDDDMLNGADAATAAAEDYLVTVGELEGDDQEDAGMEDDGVPPGWYTSEQRLQETRKTHRRNDKDTGSPEYQVAGMTERIAYLTKHLQLHPKDFSTRRGLVAMVNKRRRLLNYLAREDETRYVSIVQSLGIRHRAPGKVPDREQMYSRYPGQKSVKKHLVKKR